MSEKYRTREERRHIKKSKKRLKKSKGPLLKKIFIFILLIGIIGIITGATTFFVLAKDAPPLDEAALRDPLSSKVYDKNGELIYEFGSEKRTFVSYNEIPEIVRNAFIATEDARFFKHHGIDVVRFAGAVVANITDGFGSEGASTITQQVVKNSFLTNEKTIKRKAQELWLSFQLESKYSKQEILEMYLNKIYFGPGNTHGVAKASEVYFGKPLNELDLHEAALLAGLPKSPTYYNPFNYPEAAEKRRNIVLTLMERHGFISKAEADAAKAIDVETSLVDSKPESQPIDSFIDQVKKEISEEENIDVFTGGLEIYTTFDSNAQEHIDYLLSSDEIINYPNDDFQAGIALIDTKTGEIRALGGGRNQSATTRINFAIDPLNQPGSTIKPILDYGPAIEHLKWSTYHQIDDEPYSYSDGTPIKNWDGKHLGKMSIRTALAKSRNIPALKALQAVGLEKARQFAVSLGIPFKDTIFESYSIGGVEEGISPLQMAGAYGAFGNNGIFIKPHAVKKIVFPDDTEMDLSPEQVPVMKDSTAFLVTDMLKSVLQPGGTASNVNVPGLHIAGKTGTTNFDRATREKYNIPGGAVPDAWFVGYTPSYTAAVWTGYRDSKQWMQSTAEQQIAKQIFKSIITKVSAGEDTSDFKMPNSVVKVAVEKGSDPAKLASEFTPKEEIEYEYFIKGTEPVEVSTKYEVLPAPTEVQIAYDEETNEITLSWGYAEEYLDKVTFEISQSIDEGSFTLLTTTKDFKVIIKDPIPEAKYSFKIEAINLEDEENRSEAVVTSIEIPGKPEDELDVIPGEEEKKEDPVDEDKEEDGSILPPIINPPGNDKKKNN
ncbi:PBP1A family penicillin-binding protein [Bacillus timonensis]|nr:PBP1A family penicillin-binding protein [Bacillus timonensis]